MSEYRAFPNAPRRNWFQEHLEIPLLLKALGLPRNARILEVGCGRGIALATLARSLAPTYLAGLDLDATILIQAKERLSRSSTRADVVLADIRHVPFRDAAFDIVMDFGTCYHIAHAEGALREITRVLVPGGILVTETKLNQLLSHPVRAWGRHLPWAKASALIPLRRAVLWQSHRRGDA